MFKSILPVANEGRSIDLWSDTDFPISVIPNNMGINLCNVESIEQIKQADGQFISVLINFKPNPKENDFERKKQRLTQRVDASKALENKLKLALRDFWSQVSKHSPSINTAVDSSKGLSRHIQSSFNTGRQNFHYYLLQFENKRFEGYNGDIIVTASFHKDGKKCVEFDIFKIKFFANGYQNEIEWLKGFDFLIKYA